MSDEWGRVGSSPAVLSRNGGLGTAGGIRGCGPRRVGALLLHCVWSGAGGAMGMGLWRRDGGRFCSETGPRAGGGGECGATRRLTSQSAGTGPIRISIQYSQYAPRRLTNQGVPPTPSPFIAPPIRLLQIVRWS